MKTKRALERLRTGRHAGLKAGAGHCKQRTVWDGPAVMSGPAGNGMLLIWEN
jgi:hypothetical protein